MAKFLQLHGTLDGTIIVTYNLRNDNTVPWKEMTMAAMAIAALEKKVAKDTIDQARKMLGLDYVELASALGVDRRTVFRYRAKTTVPSPAVRARLGKLREIAHLLDAVFASHDAQLEWLYSPVPLLRDRCPIELIREGKLDEVLSILAGVHTGASS